MDSGSLEAIVDIEVIVPCWVATDSERGVAITENVVVKDCEVSETPIT